MLMNEAFALFEDAAADCDRDTDDTVAMREAWNDFTDGLSKNNRMTELQYHYCPAYDDDMPQDEDAEREHILQGMGFNMEYVTTTRDSEDMRHIVNVFPEGSHYFVCAIQRGASGDVMTVPFVMSPNCNPAYPTLQDVLHALVMESISVDSCDGFEDYCEELDLDQDDPAEQRRYALSVKQAAQIKALVGTQYWEDFQELFSDY